MGINYLYFNQMAEMWNKREIDGKEWEWVMSPS